MSSSRRILPWRHAAPILFVFLCAGFTASARETVPTPPGGGPGVSLFPADQSNPLNLPAPRSVRLDRREFAAPVPPEGRDPDLGGDDVVVREFVAAYDADIAVSSDGDLFAIFWYDVDDENDSYRFVVRRSDDGGTTWRDWGTFYNPTPGVRYWDPCIHIAEGDEDRCFVAYALDTGSGRPSEIHVAWSPLDVEYGDFSHDTIMHTAEYDAHHPSLTTDAENYSQYYVYLVFDADDGDGGDIHFARSLTQGTTWESPYVIGAISVGDRTYGCPEVAVGYNGWVHVVWLLAFQPDHEYDNALRYRRAPNYAAGGLANWENMQSLSSHLDDVDVFACAIDASLVSGDALIACMRRLRDETLSHDGIGTLSSGNSGATWTGMTEVGSGFVWVGDVVHQEANDRWLVGLDEGSSWGVRWAPVASPAAWSSLQVFSDTYYSSGEPEILLDPTHADRIGILGAGATVDDTYIFYFDAEWRTDPGYPNFEDGFPMDLAATPVSDPAIIDLDGDGLCEIVFADDAHRVQVIRHDGTPQPGWPVDVGASLSPSPIAVGDLEGYGALSVVVGTADGRVFAYHADGTLTTGWPYAMPNPVDTYVAIGSVGGPYVRAVIACAGSWVRFLDQHGGAYPGCVFRLLTGTISSAPAIGDVDGDNHNEVVVAASQAVYAFPMDSAEWNVAESLEANVSGGVALGDFNLDGDVEIVVSLTNGVLHLLEGDGEEYPGVWPLTVDDGPLNGVAIAHCVGTTAPDIAVTTHNSLVNVYTGSGAIPVGWPVDTGGWYIYGKPLIGLVEGASSDVIASSRGYRGWAWSNLADPIPGWPKALADHVYRTPAYGDLDLDGSAEIVFLGTDQLSVVDVGTPPSSASTTWGMAGHDPERTGCADCALDLVPVEEAASGVTRVSLAAPWPNPLAGRANFVYAIPVRARVELAIYDVRGRLVATVARAEQPAGRYEIAWHGRDDAGQPVASGQYLAALRVRGPGVDETQTRKITVLR